MREHQSLVINSRSWCTSYRYSLSLQLTPVIRLQMGNVLLLNKLNSHRLAPKVQTEAHLFRRRRIRRSSKKSARGGFKKSPEDAPSRKAPEEEVQEKPQRTPLQERQRTPAQNQNPKTDPNSGNPDACSDRNTSNPRHNGEGNSSGDNRFRRRSQHREMQRESFPPHFK